MPLKKQHHQFACIDMFNVRHLPDNHRKANQKCGQNNSD